MTKIGDYRSPLGITYKMIFKQITRSIYSNYFNGDTVDDLLDYCVDASPDHHFNKSGPIAYTEALTTFIWEFSNG